VIYMIAGELSPDELLRVAESMEVSEGLSRILTAEDLPPQAIITPITEEVPPAQP
jgi:hypothetical protein